MPNMVRLSRMNVLSAATAWRYQTVHPPVGRDEIGPQGIQWTHSAISSISISQRNRNKIMTFSCFL